MIIIGIDPGSVRVGYGVIKKEGIKLSHIESGLLKTDPSNRLFSLEKNLNNLLKQFRPERVGLEKLFFVKNKKTALKVAESRGVIINSILKMGIPLIEISPSEIKANVAGDGRASKGAVAKMVNYFLLDFPKQRVPDDVTDALAIAVAVSNEGLTTQGHGL